MFDYFSGESIKVCIFAFYFTHVSINKLIYEWKYSSCTDLPHKLKKSRIIATAFIPHSTIPRFRCDNCKFTTEREHCTVYLCGPITMETRYQQNGAGSWGLNGNPNTFVEPVFKEMRYEIAYINPVSFHCMAYFISGCLGRLTRMVVKWVISLGRFNLKLPIICYSN